MSDFFSHFRQVASSVDRQSTDLKSALDNPSFDENRSCLLLKRILDEVRNLQSDVNNEKKGVRKKFEGNVLAASTRLTEQMNERINSLETHLQKYGYVKPSGDLPELCVPNRSAASPQKDASNTVQVEMADKHESQSDASSSDKDEVDKADKQENSPTHDVNMEKIDENPVDPWKSPVRPATFTQMIDATPVKQLQHHETTQGTPGCQTPEPPPTATPMIRGTSVTQNDPDTQERTCVPVPIPKQPITATPMIEVLARAQDAPGSSNYSSPELPEPPVMGTPSFPQHSEPRPGSPQVNFMDDIPMAPQITSVKILQPDDLLEPSQPTSSTVCEIVSALSEEEYYRLPLYVTSQLSLDKINNLIPQINTLLSKRNTNPICQLCIQDQELCEELCIPDGAQFKTIMVALVNTGRLAVNGLTGKITFQSRQNLQ